MASSPANLSQPCGGVGWETGWAWEGSLLGFSFSQSIYKTKISVNLTAQPATPLGHTADGDRLIFGKGVPARPCQPGSRAVAGVTPHQSVGSPNPPFGPPVSFCLNLHGFD